MSWFDNAWPIERRFCSNVFRIGIRSGELGFARRHNFGARKRMAFHPMRGFRKSLKCTQPVHCSNRGSNEERNLRTTKSCKRSNGGASNKADAKCRTDETHVARSLTSGRNVSDCRLSHRYRCTGNTVDDSTKKENPKRAGETSNKRTDGGAEQRNNDDRLSTNAVAQLSPHRGEDQLRK